MYFSDQKSYEHYHSPEQRRLRAENAELERLAVVTKALALFEDGDFEGARQVLFDGGITEDGIAEYLRLWHS